MLLRRRCALVGVVGVALLAAQARAAEPDPDPAADSISQVGVAQARATSATRLRRMLGAQGSGPALLRARVVGGVDSRHPKVAAVRAAVEAARAERMATRFYDVTLDSSTKAQVDGYYEYVIHDTSLDWDTGPMRLQAGYRYGAGLTEDGRYPDYWGELQTQDGGEVRLEIGLDLLESLITDEARTRRRTASEGISLAEAELTLTDLVVTRDAVAAWSKWVATGRIVALDEALLAIAQQREDAVEQRIDLGDLAPIELVRNRQILAKREAELAEARGDFTGATEKLSLYLRSEDSAPIRPSRERLPARDAAPQSAAGFDTDPVALALQVHPLLRAARARLQISLLEQRLARNRLLPELQISAALSQDLGSEISSLSPMVTVLGGKVKVPLANWKDRGKSRAAAAKRDKAAQDLVWLEDQIVADVRAALAREEAALVAWRRSAESVELALQLQDAEQRRFDVGDIDLLRLWQIEQETAKAIRTEVKAWQAYQVAVAELELAVGQRFE